jgi:hypothetical protein
MHSPAHGAGVSLHDFQLKCLRVLQTSSVCVVTYAVVSTGLAVHSLCQTGLATVSPLVRPTLTRSVPPYLSNPRGKGLPREEGLARSVQPLARALYEGLTRPAIRLNFTNKGHEGL